MELLPLYLQRLEEATQRGIEQGIEQGKGLIFDSIL